MKAMPSDTAMTAPVLDTVATLWSLLCHVTLRSVAFAGVTFAVRLPVSPMFRVSVSGEIATSVGSTTAAATVMVAVAVRPFEVVAVIVAAPADWPVTMPIEDTDATEVLLEDQVTVRFDAFAGNTVAVMA